MRIATLAAFGLLGLSALPAAAASTTDLDLFRHDPGTARAFACYERHYDAAHLKSHPRQNVTDMTLLVDSTVDERRSYSISIGVNFHKVKNQFDVSGSCDGTIDGKSLLNCAVDCDGGAIDVRLRDQNTILVEIPYGARTWDATADPEASDEPADNPDAAFGSDDKLFRLDRAALEVCANLLADPDDRKLLSDGK